ncbi:MAG: GAF domain-containing protein, partial [Caldisericia bacterium]|nr:GAF domain-containing protein [Caldisericia bacterium]
MNKEELFEKLTPIIRVVIDGGENLVPKLQTICSLLNENVEYYDWVGFYFLEEGMLHLGPYVGSETEHGEIELGK